MSEGAKAKGSKTAFNTAVEPSMHCARHIATAHATATNSGRDDGERGKESEPHRTGTTNGDAVGDEAEGRPFKRNDSAFFIFPIN